MEINLKNISCGYGNKKILENITFNLKTGECICVLGANGIGKSTLFKTMLTVLPALSGQMSINGKDVCDFSQKEISTYISYVPQAKDCSYQYSVFDVVLMGRAPYIRMFSSPSENDRECCIDALNLLGILNLKDRQYSELSGGEQQLVLIARAVAQNTKFIVMDEPSSNLDLGNQNNLLDIIKKLKNDGKGIIMSSHTPEQAFYCCEEVLLFNKNRTYKYGNCNDILTSENLSATYGTNVHVITSQLDGHEIRTCCLDSTGFNKEC